MWAASTLGIAGTAVALTFDDDAVGSRLRSLAMPAVDALVFAACYAGLLYWSRG